MRKFDTVDLVVVRKQVKPNRKYGISQELVLKKGTLQITREGYTKLILDSESAFL